MEVWKGYGSRNACLLCGRVCSFLLLITRVIRTESRDDANAERTIAFGSIDFHSTAYAFWEVFTDVDSSVMRA